MHFDGKESARAREVERVSDRPWRLLCSAGGREGHPNSRAALEKSNNRGGRQKGQCGLLRNQLHSREEDPHEPRHESR